MSVNLDMFGRLDPELNPITAIGFQDDDFDFVPDHQFFSGLSSQYEHETLLQTSSSKVSMLKGESGDAKNTTSPRQRDEFLLLMRIETFYFGCFFGKIGPFFGRTRRYTTYEDAETPAR